jgi:hypothetical protein
MSTPAEEVVDELPELPPFRDLSPEELERVLAEEAPEDPDC